MKRAFVSYSRVDLEIVTQLVQDLQAIGIQTWHDKTLSGGQRWWDAILQNLRECDIFIFSLSPESWASEACRSELQYALQLSKVILPVLVADGINLNLLPSAISDIQITDYRRRDKDAAFALVRSINSAAPAGPLPDPLPPAPRVPVSYLSTLKERIDSPAPLSAQEQIGLVFELEAAVRDGRPAAEMQDLLLALKRRDDLLAKVATRVDEALSTLGGRIATVAPPRNASLAPPPPPPPTNVAATPAAVPPPLPTTSDQKAKVARSECRRYACPQAYYLQVIGDVRGWLDAEGFDCQQITTENASILLQVKKRGSWRDFVGMATSLNIVFGHSSDFLTVEIGAGKWLDKATAGGAGMLVLWPLAITAGMGAWEQMKLPDRVFAFVASRLVYA